MNNDFSGIMEYHVKKNTKELHVDDEEQSKKHSNQLSLSLSLSNEKIAFAKNVFPFNYLTTQLKIHDSFAKGGFKLNLSQLNKISFSLMNK